MKKIKRTSIAKLLASYFVNREIFMKRVYTFRVDPAKENKYMIITSEGFEIYDASKKVDGSKLWYNCNPAGPYHWFKLEYLDKIKEKRMFHLHFTMDDNLSLSERMKERYKRTNQAI